MRPHGLLLSLLGLVTCAAREERAPSRTNVVLVTVDTLRADRLGAYGNASGLTPNLDRLARSGVVFENASAAAPLTLPSHASILTGTYPLRHGVRDNGGYHLAPESVTLAETLAARSYRTGAFVGAFVLDSRWGLDQGFERYFDDFDFESFDDVSLGSVSRRGDEVVSEALAWMGGAKAGPFFAWLHLYDPHAPYEPPEPYRSRRAGERYGLYDGEVVYVDELIGRLLDWLSRESLDEATVVVVMADHGEALEDHGELDHGFFIYDATMKVPFIIRAPALPKGVRVRAQVRSIDLMPTVLDLVGLPPEPSVQGTSLLPLALGESRASISSPTASPITPDSITAGASSGLSEAKSFISSTPPPPSSTTCASTRGRLETSPSNGRTPSPSFEGGSRTSSSGTLERSRCGSPRRSTTRPGRN